MPFYEFYCAKCHKIFNFFSKTVNTESCPDCPKCCSKLDRQISKFVAAKDLNNPKADSGGFQNPNDAQFQKLISKIGAKAKDLNSSDPKVVAGLLKEISGADGAIKNSRLDKLVDYLEKGDGGAELEAELESLITDIETDSETEFGDKSNPKNRLTEPSVDDEIYEL